MTTNSQLSTTEPKQKQKQNKKQNTKELTRTGTESQKWRSHGGLPAGRAKGGQGPGNKKHKWQVQNRQGEVKNSMGNREAKELICMTHGHELRWGNASGWGGGTGWRGIKGRKKWDDCNSIINKIYIFLKA